MRRRLTESDMVVSMVKSGEDGPGFRVTYIVTTSGNTLLYSPTVYVGPSPTTSPRPTQGEVSVTPSNLTNMVSLTTSLCGSHLCCRWFTSSSLSGSNRMFCGGPSHFSRPIGTERKNLKDGPPRVTSLAGGARCVIASGIYT